MQYRAQFEFYKLKRKHNNLYQELKIACYLLNYLQLTLEQISEFHLKIYFYVFFK